MSEWRELALGEVIDFCSGGTPSKARSDFWGGIVPWVSAKDMKKYRLDDTQDHLTEEGAANGTRFAPTGSVLMLTRGMTLLNDVPICVISKPMTFNQDIKALRPKSCICEEFLPYLLLGNKDRLLNLVDLAGHGTGRLNSVDLKLLDISLPPLPEQKAIARIISSLDDKIELNRRMNETLEEMARAIFKDWFIDFGPTRAKQVGRAPYLPEPLWSLFPEAIDDETGLPLGWRSSTVEDFMELAYGKSLPAKNRRPGHVVVYGSGGQTGFHDEAFISSPAVIVGRKGTVGSIYWEERPIFPIDTVFYVVPKKTSLLFCYQLLLAQPLADMNTDAAVPGLNRNNAYRLEFPYPSADLVNAYEVIVSPIWTKRGINLSEIETLTETRDRLLPKLMSGEIRVKEAEKRAEEAL